MAYANSADPDQIAPKEQSDQGLLCLHSTKYFKKQVHVYKKKKKKKKNLNKKKKVWNRVFERHWLYLSEYISPASTVFHQLFALTMARASSVETEEDYLNQTPSSTGNKTEVK